MLIYVALCVAATLAAAIAEPIPVFSPVYSMRIERPGRAQHIWVDTVKNRARTDFLDVEGQGVFENYNEEWQQPIVHWVFPVTTEERMNVRKCFIGDSWYALQFVDTLHTLPPSMADFHFVGRERMHDEEATKWKATYLARDYIFEVIIWVANRDGVSVPLRMIISSVYGKIRRTQFADFFDYDISDIDPEVWNIGAGMNCKLGLDAKNNSDLITTMTMTDLMNDPKEFNWFNSLAGNLWRYDTAVNQLTGRSKEMGFKRDHVQTSYSRQSKALPFPYTAEEVERLSKKLPKHFDWRVYGAVQRSHSDPDKLTQYAFAAAQAVEGALFLQRGMTEMVVPLSAQAIVDCSWGFGNRGVEGGSVEASFEWMMRHGLPLAANYPYKGDPDYCHIDSVEIEAKVKAYYSIPPNDEKALKLAIVNHGPVVVKYDSLIEYSYGIYNDTKNCRSDPGSWYYEGLLVGFGTTDDDEYWIMNTFGGNFMLITTRDNACGVMNEPVYVTVE